MRWDHPVRGRVPPSEFIPLAEETGLIRAIGRHVLDQACRQSRRWRRRRRRGPLRMHVNLSAAELRDPELTADVRAVLEAGELDAGAARAGDHRDRAAQRRRDQRRALAGAALARRADRARRLRHGLLVAQLPALAAARQPQDRQAVRRRADGGGREASFIGVIVELARKLDLEVIAEGIETPAQLRALRELGVELGQGFLVGRPAAPRTGPLPPPGRSRVLVLRC